MESMAFDHTPLTTTPLTFTMVFLFKPLKICTENNQINTTKTGLNEDLVLGDMTNLRSSLSSQTSFCIQNKHE